MDNTMEEEIANSEKIEQIILLVSYVVKLNNVEVSESVARGLRGIQIEHNGVATTKGWHTRDTDEMRSIPDFFENLIKDEKGYNKEFCIYHLVKSDGSVFVPEETRIIKNQRHKIKSF